MTVPVWAPFALLAAVCAAVPAPAWVRRVDWLLAGIWTLFLVFCLAFWGGVGFLVWRVA